MTKEEILPKVLEYFKGDNLASQVCIDKYFMKDKHGNILESTPDDIHRRLAKEFARIEKNYPHPISEEEIYQLFKDFKYIVPQGSPMTGIGNDNLIISLSNCFVIGENGDSYGSIMRADEEQVQIAKRRGGVGHDLSHLRPNGSMANNSVLSDMAGSILYAQRYSNSTKEVRQGDRRGALMLSMSCQHPDAERFIDSKLEGGNINDANISLRITDEFMDAVKGDADFYQTFPIGYDISGYTDRSRMEYDKLEEHMFYNDEFSHRGDIVYVKKIKAKKLWDKLMYNSWKSAEPGILFWDKIITESPADCYEQFETVGVNPCSELSLARYDSCRLLLLNLYSYVINPFQDNCAFNYHQFEQHVRIAQRLMDDLVDLEIEKIDKITDKIANDPESDNIKSVEMNLWRKIRQQAVEGRRTGLGITGEGDMLAAMNFVYGSEGAIEFSTNVHKTLAVNSYMSSIVMASERGCFKDWSEEAEKHNPFIQRVMNEINQDSITISSLYKESGRRNIANLTIAPAGTVSLMTQTTSGVEPCFKIYYKRRRRTTDKALATFTDEQGEMFVEYNVFHHKFEEWYDVNWYKTSPELFNLDFKKPLDMYTREELDLLITKSPYYKATSDDVNWVNKVKMQGSIQKWVDHSISATCNIPENTTVETVNQIYLAAYESGCKGMTIYREGSRSGILVSQTEPTKEFNYIDAVKRPEKLECDIYHKTALKQNWMLLVGKYNGKPFEVFAFPEVANHLFPTKITKGTVTKIKSRIYKLVGNDPDSDKAYTIPNIIDLIDNIDQVSTRKYSMMLRHHIDPKWIIEDIESYAIVTSFDKVVSRVLKNYIKQEKGVCPECGGELTHTDGCNTCKSCGWSKCS